nr:hypothetical protein [Paenibacillus curdlanolyticus]
MTTVTVSSIILITSYWSCPLRLPWRRMAGKIGGGAGMDMFLMNKPTDAIHARQRGRELARSVGFSAVEQTRIAFTISEMAAQLLESKSQGHMIIKTIHRNNNEMGIEVRLYDHSSGSSHLDSDWMLSLVDDIDICQDMIRGTTISYRKWLSPSRSYDRLPVLSVLAAGEE